MSQHHPPVEQHPDPTMIWIGGLPYPVATAQAFSREIDRIVALQVEREKLQARFDAPRGKREEPPCTP